MPGTTTPLPEPSDADSDAASPRASTTEMCVVPESSRAATPPRWSARTNAPPRTASCASIAATSASGVGSALPSSFSPYATNSPPLDGGGFERNSCPRYATTTGCRRITR